MKLVLQVLLCTQIFLGTLWAQEKESIRILAVRSTPEPSTAILALQVPKVGKSYSGNPIWMQVRVDGYALGADSQFDRSFEIANSREGQTLHVVIDERPYFTVSEPAIDPFNEQGWYYDQYFRFEVPYKLEKGFHTVRMFLARSYGESLKGMFVSSYFYVGERGNGSESIILNEPFLTYNEPSRRMKLKEGEPVLLDFYVSNAELTPDGYKVKMTIDDSMQRTLTHWQPYYIYGLKKGKHVIRLELLDRKDRVVSGPYSVVEGQFTIR